MKNPASFWQWFRANESRFRNVEVPEKEQLLDEFMAQLHEFSDELWFQLGGHPNGPHDLIITAEGNLDAFHKVRRLVGAAPQIPGWQFIAFKPAHGFDFVTSYRGLTFAPEATWFLPLESREDPESLGLRVAYAHFDPSRQQDFLTAAYIMLEGGLGELVTAERIQYVEVGLLPSVPEAAGYIEINELSDYLVFRARRAGI
jgi:hypothetical protein